MTIRIFTRFPGDGKVLGNLCGELLQEQKKNWPALLAAYNGLSEIGIRTIPCCGDKIIVQFNPARSVSSGAAVDKESIKNRPCFLCGENLPREQKAILYQNEYLILCNPAPVFANHYTVVNIQHRPQALAPALGRFLDLSRDLSPGFILFYNGPACGASAPDHLHFQAIPAGVLPLVESFPRNFNLVRDDTVKYYLAEETDRGVVVLTGRDWSFLFRQVKNLFKAVQKVVPTAAEEPLVNVLCSYTGDGWLIMIFLRAAHRPSAFFREGAERIFVSPGAIDMAGVMITPLFNDFQRLDAGQISSIYREVSLTPEQMKNIIDQL